MTRHAIFAAMALVCVAAPALADGCVPIGDAKRQFPSLADAKPLNAAQFWFMSGLYFSNPDTPLDLPHGDHAVISRDGGKTTVTFLDGDVSACERMSLFPKTVQMLDAVGAGKTNMEGDRL